MQATVTIPLDPAIVVGATKLGRMFRRSRYWGMRMLREWWREQQQGGQVKVFRRESGHLYTTIAIVDATMPRGRRDEAMERRLGGIERDLGEAFSRLAELERRIGRRR